MPTYVYKAKNANKSCGYCKNGFEIFQGINDKPICRCPECGAAIRKVITAFFHGFSQSGMDRKAKEKGFHKLKKVDKGKYEKLY